MCRSTWLPLFAAVGVPESTIIWRSARDFNLAAKYPRFEPCDLRDDPDLILCENLCELLHDVKSLSHPESVRAALGPVLRRLEWGNSTFVAACPPGTNPKKPLSYCPTFLDVAHTVVRLRYDKGPPERGRISVLTSRIGLVESMRSFTLPQEQGMAPRFVFGMPADLEVPALPSQEPARFRSRKKEQARALIRTFLEHGPRPSSFIEDRAKGIPLSHGTLQAAAQELGVWCLRSGKGSAHGSLWALADPGDGRPWFQMGVSAPHSRPLPHSASGTPPTPPHFD
jgi:hypothetical protein